MDIITPFLVIYSCSSSSNFVSYITSQHLDNIVYHVGKRGKYKQFTRFALAFLFSFILSFASQFSFAYYTNPPTFEQNLWLCRFITLHDAIDLDFPKQLLLNNICLDRNISLDLQLCIRDYIKDHHWYELYRHYDRYLNGNIIPLRWNEYKENDQILPAANSYDYDEEWNFIAREPM